MAQLLHQVRPILTPSTTISLKTQTPLISLFSTAPNQAEHDSIPEGLIDPHVQESSRDITLLKLRDIRLLVT